MSSGFITEAEIEEKRRVRQLEWEKVRKPEEPLEAPAEPVDNRSLYDRLQEQKNKKQEEFEEAHKLKNLVKTLDDDECLFLDQVDQVKLDEEKRKRLEEAQELNDFRTAVSQHREKEYDQAIRKEISMAEKNKQKNEAVSVSIGLTRTSQSKLVAGIVKRKHPSASQDEDVVSEKKSLKSDSDAPNSSDEVKSETGTIASVPYKGNLVCIGVLPGLSSYDNSDEEDDDDDSDSDHEDCDGHGEGHDHKHGKSVRDLCGRKVEYDKESSK